MTKLIVCIFFVLVSSNIFADIELETIPHYKVLPKTPIIGYEGEILDFYSTKNLYGEFSNFALFPIIIDGKDWETSEHYFQAQKFLDLEIQEKIRNTKSPYDVVKIARAKGMPVREDWIQVRDEVMKKAVREKFSSYSVLRNLLLSTNNSKIFEHTENDCYWGDCGDRTGKNKLGLILMQVREELSHE